MEKVSIYKKISTRSFRYRDYNIVIHRVGNMFSGWLLMESYGVMLHIFGAEFKNWNEAFECFANYIEKYYNVFDHEYRILLGEEID